MNIAEMGYGLFGTYLIANELKCFGKLPNIPKGYTLNEINSDYEVVQLFESLIKWNKKLDEVYKEEIDSNTVSFELTDYEAECFFIGLKFDTICNHWFGWCPPSIELINNKTVVMKFELLECLFWDYLKGECTLNHLYNETENFYRTYIQEITKK